MTITRAARTVQFPARFTLVAAMNPCPCGFSGDPRRACRCTPVQVERYRGRLSGPLLDRIDLVVEVPSLPVSRLFGRLAGKPSHSESSAQVRARVLAARERQRRRFAGRAELVNAAMAPEDLSVSCRLDAASLRLLDRAGERLVLSARGCTRVLKVARTIGDLAGCEDVSVEHVAEALQYRLVPPSGAG